MTRHDDPLSVLDLLINVTVGNSSSTTSTTVDISYLSIYY